MKAQINSGPSIKVLRYKTPEHPDKKVDLHNAVKIRRSYGDRLTQISHPTQKIFCIPWQIYLHSYTVRMHLNGHLGSIKVWQHRINFENTDNQPVTGVPHRSRPMARELENRETNRTLVMNFIAPAQVEWVSLIFSCLERTELFICASLSPADWINDPRLY